MVKGHIIVICVLLLLLGGCTTVAEHPRLSRHNVLRVAQTRVAQVLGPSYAPPQEFEPPEPRYFADKRVWYVNYRRLGQRYADFNVEVNDLTGEATITMP